MSRSLKKNPVVTEYSRFKTKMMKRLASKKARRTELEGKGGSYKRVFSSCNIRDYRTYCYAAAENEGHFNKKGEWVPSLFTKEAEMSSRRK